MYLAILTGSLLNMIFRMLRILSYCQVEVLKSINSKSSLKVSMRLSGRQPQIIIKVLWMQQGEMNKNKYQPIRLKLLKLNFRSNLNF